MRVGIDIDDVVIDFVKYYLKFHNSKFETNFYFNNISKHLFWENLGLTSNEIQPLFQEFTQKYISLENFPLINGCKDAIISLSKNAEIFFITSRPEYIIPESRKFLEKNFQEIDYQLIRSGEIYGKGKTKAEICKDLDVKILIEDNLIFCLNCSNLGINSLLFNKPWNQQEELPQNITRVKNWNEILERLI